MAAATMVLRPHRTMAVSSMISCLCVLATQVCMSGRLAMNGDVLSLKADMTKGTLISFRDGNQISQIEGLPTDSVLYFLASPCHAWMSVRGPCLWEINEAGVM
jgi:hypothetical protein